MDNLNKYLPVGEENAKPTIAVTLSGNTMTGNAWIESNTATEVNLIATTAIDNHPWVISGAAVTALGTDPPPPPQAEAPAQEASP
jgi:hypothetical protein